ncbi:MAG: hypothetical protein KC656_21735 [Myxococcales bacterium]|nr:hypothetical protein [Myxococcales bacterium]MCB9664231.1 hypothetical protein [Alphaproteobacteria bacterium]
MGRVVVQGAVVTEGRLQQAKVKLDGLPARVLDRDAVVAWMREGHSFLPARGGTVGRALQLVEVDGDWFVRDDHEAEASDALGDLPPV